MMVGKKGDRNGGESSTSRPDVLGCDGKKEGVNLQQGRKSHDVIPEKMQK